jgi:hypothetical protein
MIFSTLFRLLFTSVACYYFLSTSQGDRDNNLIRMIDVSSRAISTVAGRLGVSAPFSDGSGTDATFNLPHGIAIDSSGSFAIVVGFEIFVTVSLFLAAVLSFDYVCLPLSGPQIDQLNSIVRVASFKRLMHSSPTLTQSSTQAPSLIQTASASPMIMACPAQPIVQLVNATVKTLAGQQGVPSFFDGIGTAAAFSYPQSVALNFEGTFALVVRGYMFETQARCACIKQTWHVFCTTSPL